MTKRNEIVVQRNSTLIEPGDPPLCSCCGCSPLQHGESDCVKDLSLNQLNHTFAHELTPADETFNRNDGLLYTEAGMRLLLDLLHFPFNLGTNPLLYKDTESGVLSGGWKYEEGDDASDGRCGFGDPREGHLETGEEHMYRFSCDPHNENIDQASFIWQLRGGAKQVVKDIACQILNQTEAHVVFESGRGAETTAMHFLEQVLIGEVDAPMKSIVLRNEGWTSFNDRFDLTEVERLNASASDFPPFRPLMQRGYLERIPINLGSRFSSMSEINANVGIGGVGGGDGNVNGTNHSPSSNNGIVMGIGGAQGGAQGAAGGGSDGTEGITHMKTVLQALLEGDGFIAKEGAEPLVDEKKTATPCSSFSASWPAMLIVT
ncbi:uncharacterized protein MONOS_16326 [Monocercomonoides exilis]|uniref:uncharacterized protein n=1 Tax=Monocercomonoides exilis TaxID=2049356 RepID=UPI00355988D9|nr:hypothetical protein MONOS_16326 [Monocercomonoides exilis]|eukprot:MONOS_16326.1-p1 / transcript=MONOS_16326.1 / gene=MONOS_16326 / organism=Monocercomonoides_exilis_PA203 / gene_product=unspecified product / transcript_product=unspecified product / location=Mono_scaffold01650:2225-3759(-) / protein_length=375 / sequence_SO=supercontig / SO=protein_coding / is_pseudo=false